MFPRGHARAPRKRLGRRAIVVVIVALSVAVCSRKERSDPGAGESHGPQARASPELEDGVALAIVYDTSGSMKDPVPDREGRPTPKYVIANRALETVVGELEDYVRGGTPEFPRRLDVGLIVFDDESAVTKLRVAPFDAAALRAFAASFARPVGATPLGKAVERAGLAVIDSRLARKHVLVITDGVNTVGPEPAKMLASVAGRAKKRGVDVASHFIAFDVAEKLFEPVQRAGAALVGAANAVELEAQLKRILEQDILLEVEDPPANTTGR